MGKGNFEHTIIELMPEDLEYPKNLLNIKNRPKKLYAIGNIDLLNQKMVAVVGSRHATEYGQKCAIEIAKFLSDNEIVVVSGLAYGIDKYSHEGALLGKSHKTVAVVANSLEIDDLYPKENKDLYLKILDMGGCIVSEYPIGTKAQKEFFPARNRIISGLSEKLIVVEASLKSGTFITVDYALEQGKDVYAVPGGIYSYQSMGCNKLISEGANVILGVDDVLF